MKRKKSGNEKLYIYPLASTILWVIVGIICAVSLVMALILDLKKAWILFLPLFSILFCICYVIRIEFFTPIYLLGDQLEYRGKKYFWDDIRITIYTSTGSGHWSYLIFGEKYLNREELKSELKKKFYVYLNQKNLDTILKYYNRVILLDDDDRVRIYRKVVSKKIQATIRDHNSKYER